MHDLLYENQRRLRDADLHAYAERLALDVERFDKEMAERVHAARVYEDFMSGVRSGVNGTPTFYINGGGTTTRTRPRPALRARGRRRGRLGRCQGESVRSGRDGWSEDGRDATDAISLTRFGEWLSRFAATQANPATHKASS